MASRYWVIFDTCSVPEYYRDLHTVLASPSGAVVRYSYRAKYLTEEAIELAKKWLDRKSH